jgi:hypothetical protein
VSEATTENVNPETVATETEAETKAKNPANAEAAKWRHTVKERDAALAAVQAELAALKAKEAETEKARLAEQGKFKELFESQVPKIKELETKAQAYDNYVQSRITQLEGALPAETLAKVPGLTGDARIAVLELLVDQQTSAAAKVKPTVATPNVNSPGPTASSLAQGTKLSLSEAGLQMSRIASDPKLSFAEKAKQLEAIRLQS